MGSVLITDVRSRLADWAAGVYLPRVGRTIQSAKAEKFFSWGGQRIGRVCWSWAQVQHAIKVAQWNVFLLQAGRTTELSYIWLVVMSGEFWLQRCGSVYLHFWITFHAWWQGSIVLTDDKVSLQIGRSFFEILLAHFQCTRVHALGLLSIFCRVLSCVKRMPFIISSGGFDASHR